MIQDSYAHINSIRLGCKFSAIEHYVSKVNNAILFERTPRAFTVRNIEGDMIELLINMNNDSIANAVWRWSLVHAERFCGNRPHAHAHSVRIGPACLHFVRSKSRDFLQRTRNELINPLPRENYTFQRSYFEQYDADGARIDNCMVVRIGVFCSTRYRHIVFSNHCVECKTTLVSTECHMNVRRLMRVFSITI